MEVLYTEISYNCIIIIYFKVHVPLKNSLTAPLGRFFSFSVKNSSGSFLSSRKK